jgi:hypothetical protein
LQKALANFCNQPRPWARHLWAAVLVLEWKKSLGKAAYWEFPQAHGPDLGLFAADSKATLLFRNARKILVFFLSNRYSS